MSPVPPPTISVVVPVYNGAHVLPTTLAASGALAGVAEVVWVDDGSTDGTADALAAGVSDRDGWRVVTLPENRGRSAARNAGVDATTGDVVVFLDADAEPPPSAALALADAARQPGAVAGVARLAPVPDRPDDPYQDYAAGHARGPAPDHPPGAPLDWRFFLTTACAVRRDALDAAGGFDESVAYGEDQALARRLADAAPGGLRLADATVRLHDLGTLDRAVAHAETYGRGLAASGATGELGRARWLGPLAPAAAYALGRAVRRLGPGPLRRRLVRYVLGLTALAGSRRA